MYIRIEECCNLDLELVEAGKRQVVWSTDVLLFVSAMIWEEHRRRRRW
jgi:hypothetical protein